MKLARWLSNAALVGLLACGCGSKQAEKPASSCGDASSVGKLVDVPGHDVADGSGGLIPMPDNGQPPDMSAASDATAVDAQVAATPDAQAATADGQSADADAKAAVMFPHWLDEHGCEYYEHFDAALSVCRPDNAFAQLDELACWSHGQANDLGVGMPCKPGAADCPAGQKANCCHVAGNRYGAICTMYCANAGKPDPACGPGAWCGPMNVCLPEICKIGFTDSQKPQDRDVTALGLPCGPTPSNGLLDGVGVACTEFGSECASLKANKCLGVQTKPLAAGVASFCSHGCDTDADCGAGASCVYYNGKPYFCAPTSCKSQFAGFTFANAFKNPEFPVCNQAPKP